MAFLIGEAEIEEKSISYRTSEFMNMAVVSVGIELYTAVKVSDATA